MLPDGEEYEDARNVWNGIINTYPAVVARMKGATDVARAIGFARGDDLEISIRGGAHHQTGVGKRECEERTKQVYGDSYGRLREVKSE